MRALRFGDWFVRVFAIIASLIPNPNSRSLRWAARRHCRDDRDLRLLTERRGQPLQESHILIIDKNIDKAVHPAVAVYEAGLDAGESLIQIVHEVYQRRPAGLHHSLVSRKLSQWCRNTDLRHIRPHSLSPMIPVLERWTQVPLAVAPSSSRAVELRNGS